MGDDMVATLGLATLIAGVLLLLGGGLIALGIFRAIERSKRLAVHLTQAELGDLRRLQEQIDKSRRGNLEGLAERIEALERREGET